jgi:hypothetical protein
VIQVILEERVKPDGLVKPVIPAPLETRAKPAKPAILVLEETPAMTAQLDPRVKIT